MPSCAAMDTLGRHVLAELEGCDAAMLDDVATLRQHMQASIESVGATVVGEAFHKYQPQGVSGVLLIAESHMSVHTWPEAGYAAVDIYTCGGLDPRPGIEELARRLGAEHCRLSLVQRGVAGAAPALTLA